MTVEDFIANFIEPNSMMRVHYKLRSGYQAAAGDKIFMSWELAKEETFKNNEVIGVKDIYYAPSLTNYTEAINLIIKK